MVQVQEDLHEDLSDVIGQKVSVFSLLDWYPAVSGKLFSDVILPGKGCKPRGCESWSPTFFCPNCGKPHFTKGNCGKSTCPDCEVDWRFGRCQSIMERVVSLKIQKSKRCRHFTVSPDVEDYPESMEDLRELRKDVYEFVKSKGVEGGCVVFHPFRILNEVKLELWGEIEESGNSPNDFRLWKNLLKKDWCDILKSVCWGPHFHILGVGEKGDKTFESAKESDKFVFKGIGELPDSEDIGKCSMYLLSHTGVFEKSHYSSIVWFGSLSPSVWSLDRAVMKLRNGSTVKDFTLDLVEDFIQNSREELSGSLECSGCGAGLLHISSAPDYFDKVSEFEEELRRAFGWWSGSIPPPSNVESVEDCWSYISKDVDKVSRMAAGVDRSHPEVEGLGG